MSKNVTLTVAGEKILESVKTLFAPNTNNKNVANRVWLFFYFLFSRYVRERQQKNNGHNRKNNLSLFIFCVELKHDSVELKKHSISNSDLM